jgi:hypothetical protein
MQLRDRVRTEGVVRRLSWRLSWGMVPARQQREIVRELRASLEEAAAAGQLDEALERLGPTRQLADDYLDALRPRPRWAAGIVAAGVTLGLLILATTALAIAFGAGLDAANATAGRYELWPDGPFGGQPLVVEVRDADGATVSASLAVFTPLHLAATLAVFIAASRPWSALHRRAATP